MVRLQHQFRRGPGEGITVGTTRYKLDEEGIVEVTEEHAQMMLAPQGTQWAPPGTWAPPPPPVPVVEGAVARRPRTREELAAAAAAEGIVVPPAPVAEEVVAEVVVPPAVNEAGPEEVIEISPTTPLADLKRVASKLGVAVPKRATQTQLFELLKAQGE